MMHKIIILANNNKTNKSSVLIQDSIQIRTEDVLNHKTSFPVK